MDDLARAVPDGEPVLDWLCEHEPETAIRYFQAQRDLPRAMKLLRRRGIHLQGDRAEQFLSQFSVEDRQRSLELAAMDAALLNAKGEISEAAARLRSALDRLRLESSPGQVFVALLELLYGCWLKQDFSGFEELEREADVLEDRADFADRVRYWNLKAIIRFDSGGEDEAERISHRILEAPHFGQPGIAYIQQLAALNLGVREVSRGCPEAACRQFQRALGLAREYPHRQEVLYGARLYLAGGLLEMGRHAEASEHLGALESEEPGAVGMHRKAVFRSLEGHCRVVLGDLPRAQACLEEALSILTACGIPESQEAASVLNEWAILHRRRGELAMAGGRHRQALEISEAWPHLRVPYLLQAAATSLVAGEVTAAREALDQARGLLTTRPAPLHEAAAALLGTLLLARSGEEAEAAAALADARARIAGGGFFHLAIAYPELSDDLWSLLVRTGHGDLAAQLSSRFPEAAPRAFSADGSAGTSRDAAWDLEIRCFGPLEIRVKGRPVDAWPRKGAKALLALLVTVPEGLGREEIFDRLFPEPGDADLETRLNLLSSSLRKILEPELAPRQKSRYLETVGKRLRLVTAEVRIDHREFEEAYKAGMAAWKAGRREEAVQAFRRGAGLYRGDLFDEPVLREAFDLERHRARLRAVRMQELEAGDAFERGAFEDARGMAERLLEIDPTHEEAHRLLMRIYRKFGQEDLLARQFRLCERLLRQHLDLEPSEETRTLAAAGS